MEFFSTRNKVLRVNPNGVRSTSMQLRERIWNVFYKEEYDYQFTELKDWIYELLDYYIQVVEEMDKVDNGRFH